MVSVKFSGGPELAAALAALPKRVAVKMQTDALLAAGERVQKRVSQSAPYYQVEGQHLREHILLTRLPPGRLEGGEVATAAAGLGVPKRFFYDWFLEFGTKRMAAQPFWRPAWDELAPLVQRGCLTELWALLTARGGASSGRASGGGGGLL